MGEQLGFGDYVYILQKRYGVPNEPYLHKVIGNLDSNFFVDVPVYIPRQETRHQRPVPVVACVCCGVNEREVLNYRIVDVAKQEAENE